MNNKTYELDTIPTHLIKNILPAALKTLTKIVNMSTFPLDWKTAIVRPLIKKAGLERSKKNYKPVSNLCPS